MRSYSKITHNTSEMVDLDIANPVPRILHTLVVDTGNKLSIVYSQKR